MAFKPESLRRSLSSFHHQLDSPDGLSLPSCNSGPVWDFAWLIYVVLAFYMKWAVYPRVTKNITDAILLTPLRHSKSRKPQNSTAKWFALLYWATAWPAPFQASHTSRETWGLQFSNPLQLPQKLFLPSCRFKQHVAIRASFSISFSRVMWKCVYLFQHPVILRPDARRPALFSFVQFLVTLP